MIEGAQFWRARILFQHPGSVPWKCSSTGWTSLFRMRNDAIQSATWSGASSCTAWPLLGTTCIWNLPCIWPTVKSRSRRSTPARRSNFGHSHDKNNFDKPENQPCQKCSVFDRSILHVYWFRSAEGVASAGAGVLDSSAPSSSSSATVSHRCETTRTVVLAVSDEWPSFDEGSTIGWICPMIDTRADSTFRTWPLRTMYSMAFSGLANCFGREVRKHCIELNDSSALPTRTRERMIWFGVNRIVYLRRHRWHTGRWSSTSILWPHAPQALHLRKRLRSDPVRRSWTPTHRMSDEEYRWCLILFGVQFMENLADIFC